jgi:hypothetical protein
MTEEEKNPMSRGEFVRVSFLGGITALFLGGLWILARNTPKDERRVQELPVEMPPGLALEGLSEFERLLLDNDRANILRVTREICRQENVPFRLSAALLWTQSRLQNNSWSPEFPLVINDDGKGNVSRGVGQVVTEFYPQHRDLLLNEDLESQVRAHVRILGDNLSESSNDELKALEGYLGAGKTWLYEEVLRQKKDRPWEGKKPAGMPVPYFPLQDVEIFQEKGFVPPLYLHIACSNNVEAVPIYSTIAGQVVGINKDFNYYDFVGNLIKVRNKEGWEIHNFFPARLKEDVRVQEGQQVEWGHTLGVTRLPEVEVDYPKGVGLEIL